MGRTVSSSPTTRSHTLPCFFFSFKFNAIQGISSINFQASALLDDNLKEEFVDEVSEEYDEVREDHYDSLKVFIFALVS